MKWMAALALLPAAAAAEPWEGVWSFDPEWCDDAGRIGEVTPAPIKLTEDEMLGYENNCAIASADQLDGLAAWSLELDCEAEGENFAERRLVMLAGDTLWMWLGAGDPLSFQRCTETP